MSKDGQRSLLNYLSSSISSTGKGCECVDFSTPRSRPQRQTLRTVTPTASASLSPKSKHKRRLTTGDLHAGKKRNIKMNLQNSQPQDHPKIKLSLELIALREEICADTIELIGPLKASLELLLEVKNAWEEGLHECKIVKTKNTELQVRVEKVEEENRKLSHKINELEDKLLEGNIIFQRIPEQLWEPLNTTKKKVLSAISHTISGTDAEDRMAQARQIPVKDVTRLGHYSAMHTRPCLVEFCHKGDAEYLLSNRTHLPKGVYIDKQYSDETEHEHRKL